MKPKEFMKPCELGGVAPTQERGLKLLTDPGSVHKTARRSYTGAWIETISASKSSSASKSLLHRSVD